MITFMDLVDRTSRVACKDLGPQSVWSFVMMKVYHDAKADLHGGQGVTAIAETPMGPCGGASHINGSSWCERMLQS